MTTPIFECPFCNKNSPDYRTIDFLEELARTKAENLGLRIMNQELNDRVERLELVLFRVNR